MPKTISIPAHGIPERAVSTAEAAEFLGIPEKTMVVWRSLGKGPKYYRVGKYVRYRLSEVSAWMETRDASLTGAGNGRA